MQVSTHCPNTCALSFRGLARYFSVTGDLNAPLCVRPTLPSWLSLVGRLSSSRVCPCSSARALAWSAAMLAASRCIRALYRSCRTSSVACVTGMVKTRVAWIQKAQSIDLVPCLVERKRKYSMQTGQDARVRECADLDADCVMPESTAAKSVAPSPQPPCAPACP